MLKARGAALALENLMPVAPTLPVLLQVHSSSGQCWGATFDPIAFTANSISRFKAKN